MYPGLYSKKNLLLLFLQYWFHFSKGDDRCHVEAMLVLHTSAD